MAITQNTYTGNGSTTAYSFTFPYLKTTDIKVSLDAVDTTSYTLSNATTITFTTAPTSGAAIRIYRDTSSDNLNATFYPGSAIRSSDLNNNFTQNLYVTQEADFNVDTANTTANTAKATADTALTNSATAITTANAATTTANTADTNASAAVTTANAASATATTASTNAAAAVTTANAADANATTALTNSRESDGSGGFNSAIDKANSAITTATTALNNSRESDGSGGYTSAISKANTADTNATAAVNTANAASAAVSNAVLFTLVANVAAIPGSPSNNDYVEMGDSTGVESYSPLSGVPSGFVGASGLTVRIRYDSSASSWVWMSYFANDSEDRYLTKNPTVLSGDMDCNSQDIVGVTELVGTTPALVGTGTGGVASLMVSLTSTSSSFSGYHNSELRLDDDRLDLYFGGSNYLGIRSGAGNGDLQIMKDGYGIAFYGGFTNNFLTIRPPSSFTATTYYLPAADGTANQVLTTDGSGNMSWSNGGSPTIDAGNFDSGGSLVTTSQTFDGGSFD